MSSNSKLNTFEMNQLVFWNRIWIGLFLFLVLGFGVSRLFQFEKKLTVVWMADGGIGLEPWSDGPFVVTHLATVPESESTKAVAQLTQPIAIIDSEGAKISKAQFDKLIWIGIKGQKLPRPKQGSPLRALYYCPLRTELSK